MSRPLTDFESRNILTPTKRPFFCVEFLATFAMSLLISGWNCLYLHRVLTGERSLTAFSSVGMQTGMFFFILFQVSLGLIYVFFQISGRHCMHVENYHLAKHRV